jgi:hypothetical protein
MKKLVGEGKPLHSAVDKAAKGLKRKVGTGAEFMKELMGITGIKPTEINERGLNEIMGMPKMTHDQFMANLAIRPAPAIGEKVLGGDPDHPDWIGPYHYQYTLPGGENYREMLIKAPKGVDNQEKIMELEAKLRRIPMFNSTPEQQADIAKYYNQVRELKAEEDAAPKPYRGVLHHFGGEPGILASMRVKDRLVPDLEGPHNVTIIGDGGVSNKKFNAREEAERFADVKHQGGYKTKLTPLNNKKYLHLEELQSDWHQQGRNKGYKTPEAKTQEKELKDQIDQLQKEYEAGNLTQQEYRSRRVPLQDQWASFSAESVPDAPFKKNWEEMALKRLIHHAAEKGYHGVVVTPGAEQADRYDISKHINHVIYDEMGNLRAIDKNGRTVIAEPVEPEKLHEHVGKELSEKILSNREKRLQAKDVYRTALKSDAPNEVVDPLYKEYLSHPIEYSGLDLRTGDEAMKGFYDKKVPNILNSIGKKYGVKTALHGHKLLGDPSERGDAAERLGLAHVPLANMTTPQAQAFNAKLDEANAKQLHHFPITEDMRKDILTNGLPLYKQGGKVHMAGGGDTMAQDQMRMELLNRHLKGDRLSKEQNVMLGLYHPVGGGKKLKAPTEMMQSTRVPDPNQPMVAEKTITPEDLYKGAGIPLLGDSSIGGELLTHIGNQKLRKPVELQGGKNFMRLIKPAGEEAGWASGTSVISDLANKARIAANMADKVYGLHATMSGTGADFSSMPTKAVLGMLKKSKIDPAKLDEFDAEMRKFKPKFVGIRHRNLEKQLLAPGGGEMRKLFIDRMALEPFQEAGFPDVAHARYAIQHPELLTRPINSIGAGISELDPTGRVIKNPSKIHYDYPEHLAQRQYVGGFDVPMNRGEIFQEFEKNRRMLNAEPSSDPRSFDLSTPIQKFDQEWLDKVMPIYLARRKMLLGKAKGGVIKKAEGGMVDIKNIGVEEAPNMDVKAFIPPRPATATKLPVGGIFQQTPQQPMQGMPQQQDQQPQGAPFQPQGAPAQPPSNILQMTPQGQAMSAMRPPQMARGGKVDRDMMMLHVMNRKMKVKHG